MKPEFEQLPLVRTAERFELTVDGHTAFIDYTASENLIKLIHTESPEALAGRGVAKALIEKTLHYLKENNIPLLPLCPLVFAYIKKNREWLEIVVPTYRDRFES